MFFLQSALHRGRATNAIGSFVVHWPIAGYQVFLLQPRYVLSMQRKRPMTAYICLLIACSTLTIVYAQSDGDSDFGGGSDFDFDLDDDTSYQRSSDSPTPPIPSFIIYLFLAAFIPLLTMVLYDCTKYNVRECRRVYRGAPDNWFDVPSRSSYIDSKTVADDDSFFDPDFENLVTAETMWHGSYRGASRLNNGVTEMTLHRVVLPRQRRGEITASGYDRIGSFCLDGIYNPVNGLVALTKQYTNKHKVEYRGRFLVCSVTPTEQELSINGTWYVRTNGQCDQGDFTIWCRVPVTARPMADTHLQQKQTLPKTRAHAHAHAHDGVGDKKTMPYLII